VPQRDLAVPDASRRGMKPVGVIVKAGASASVMKHKGHTNMWWRRVRSAGVIRAHPLPLLLPLLLEVHVWSGVRTVVVVAIEAGA